MTSQKSRRKMYHDSIQRPLSPLAKKYIGGKGSNIEDDHSYRSQSSSSSDPTESTSFRKPLSMQLNSASTTAISTRHTDANKNKLPIPRFQPRIGAQSQNPLSVNKTPLRFIASVPIGVGEDLESCSDHIRPSLKPQESKDSNESKEESEEISGNSYYSAPCLNGGRNNGSIGHTSKHSVGDVGGANAIMQAAQRSNGKTVKIIIADLQAICEQDSVETKMKRTLPLREMALLSHWAEVDAYYQVVITKYQGIEAILCCMHHFPNSLDLQTYGCIALRHLPNKLRIQQCGGVKAILSAMKHHPFNIKLQSAALYALKMQAPVLPKEPKEILKELSVALRNSKAHYLTRDGQEGATFLRQFLETYVCDHTRPFTPPTCTVPPSA